MTGQPRLGYHIDFGRQILWILNRKNAGTSIRKAIGDLASVCAAEALPYNRLYTITIVRHPWDRITSGLHNPYSDARSFATKVQQEILDRENPREIDWHLWPQWILLEGFRLDRLLLFERLKDGWSALQREYDDLPNLEHQNKGEYHDWRRPDGEPFDWSPLLPVYERDFHLCSGWEKA